MSFVLPPNFGQGVNEIGRLLRANEASIDEDKKDQNLREAMVECCDLLKSINLPELQARIDEIISSADEQDPDWAYTIIADDEHFEQFLNHIEFKVLEAAGVDRKTQLRIERELRKVRNFILNHDIGSFTSEVTYAIGQLREDVCALKNEQIRKDTHEKRVQDRQKRERKTIKTLGVVAVATNSVVTAIIFAPAAPFGLAASVALGTAVVQWPD